MKEKKLLHYRAGLFTVRGTVLSMLLLPNSSRTGSPCTQTDWSGQLQPPAWKASALLLSESCDAPLAKPPCILHIFKDQTV